MAMHKVQQRQLPLVFFGTGLPTLPGLVGEFKSYAERLFNFSDIVSLSEEEAATALKKPAQALGVTFKTSALKEIYRLTNGYPYFLQEWGYHAWNVATAGPITLEIVQKATSIAIARLEKSFFKVRFDRLNSSEKNFLRAMAQLEPNARCVGDVAGILKIRVTSLSRMRERLIKKGIIYSPAYGEMAFTVPLFDEFMIRAIPEFKP